MKLKSKKLIKISAALLLIFVIGGIGGVYFDQQVLPMIRASKFLSKIGFLARTAENVTVINKTEQITIKEDDSINEVASHASNAVVNIVSISEQIDPKTRMKKTVEKSGSGVVVTSDGMITTYRGAIIEKDAVYQVLLFNGSNYEAKLKGIDEFSNLVYLKIDAQNLTAISFGNSSDARPGKKLIAIGNSFGEYQNRYASGLLSNINKTFNLAGMSVASSEKLEGVLENDFNNQKEYIGGPVIGYAASMIGILGSTTVDSEEKFFLIPSNMVQKSLQRIISGNIQRPVLGAYYISITKEYSIANKINRDRGALIYAPSGKQGLAVIAGSAAEKAGLKIGDIVIEVGGKQVNLDNPLANLISEYSKGDKVEMKIDRSGKEMSLEVQL